MSSLDGPTGTPSDLLLTGERTLPGIPDERYWFQRHVVAYQLAARHVSALVADGTSITVLDAGCGEGYGLAMLADAGATRAVGVDLEVPVIDHVRATYTDGDPRIEAVRADLTSLPLPTGGVDAVVSFQVIEHLQDIPGYLAELVRVTRPGGQVWIATPNRLTFTPGSDVPVNPFHIREFTARELPTELEAAGLVVDELLGVHHGPRLAAFAREHGRPITDCLTATPPEHWDDALRRAVHATEPSDFVLTAEDLDASLDLLAITRVPARGS
ncbi:MAG: class I SAM-dependent methyltransferase [Intrasporangiaceae bacterium]|nr:class I SAM-dependent methyltransferase [Intrasporangiaceae bacterium]